MADLDAPTWQETLAAKAEEIFAETPDDGVEVGEIDAETLADLTAEPGETPAVAEETETTDQAPEPEIEQAQTPAIDPPVSWSDAMKAHFASLPPDLAEYVAKRESDANVKISQMGQEVAAARPLLDVVKAQQSHIPSNMTPAQAVEKLLQAQAMMDADPVAGLRQIARSYGIDASKIEAEAESPLYREIAGLKQQVTTLHKDLQTRAQTEHAQAVTTAERQVADWSKDKPHFAEVRQTMAQLVNAGVATDLDAAYRMALVANGKPTPEAADAVAKAAAAAQAKAKADTEAAQAAEAKKTFVPKAAAKPGPAKAWNAPGEMARRMREAQAAG
jgi:hypothetical protein